MFTTGQLTFDSVARFKGQEAPAIIVADAAPSDDAVHEARLLYSAMTRATVRLELLVQRGTWFADSLLDD